MGKPGSKASGLTRLTKSPRKPSVSEDPWPIHKVTADVRQLSLLETHAHTQLHPLQWLYVRMDDRVIVRESWMQFLGR